MWPELVEPHFYIETCKDCHNHNSMYSNHEEEKYQGFTWDLKNKLLQAIPDLYSETDGSVKILVNQFHSGMGVGCKVYHHSRGNFSSTNAKDGPVLNTFYPSDHFAEIFTRAKRRGSQMNGRILDKYSTKRFGFEVYFMGVRLYSKIESLQWPNNTLLTQKCLNAYNDYLAGQDIRKYEFQKPLKNVNS